VDAQELEGEERGDSCRGDSKRHGGGEAGEDDAKGEGAHDLGAEVEAAEEGVGFCRGRGGLLRYMLPFREKICSSK
jgi:hypothetical protein